MPQVFEFTLRRLGCGRGAADEVDQALQLDRRVAVGDCDVVSGGDDGVLAAVRLRVGLRAPARRWTQRRRKEDARGEQTLGPRRARRRPVGRAARGASAGHRLPAWRRRPAVLLDSHVAARRDAGGLRAPRLDPRAGRRRRGANDRGRGRLRQTCFCGLLRSPATASSRSRSLSATRRLIPVRMPRSRMPLRARGTLSGLSLLGWLLLGFGVVEGVMPGEPR